MDNQQEIFPIVSESGEVTGAATRGECHGGSMLLHPVVHLHVFNSKGDIYLQKRPEWKDIQPGRWDTAVGGHIAYGETPEEALRREAREELGLTDFVPEFVDRYVFESKRERELVYVNRAVFDGEIRPSAEELAGARFWSMREIGEAMGKGVLTPNFESEFRRCLAPIASLEPYCYSINSKCWKSLRVVQSPPHSKPASVKRRKHRSSWSIL
jgi:isopentenyldiphosphate isomerase